MAKELPYFKFEPSAWDNGNIQLCSSEVKGIFICICSIYWQRIGDLPYKLALQKVCHGDPKPLETLVNEEVIKVIDGQICIDFLNEQLSEFDHASQINSVNARIGWEKRKSNATALRESSDPNAIREEKRRGEKRREEDILWPNFEDFWIKYDKRTGKKGCEKKWMKLKQAEREAIMHHLDRYIPATPDPQYRKNPQTYLNQQSWNDEVINRFENGTRKAITKLTSDSEQLRNLVASKYGNKGAN